MTKQQTEQVQEQTQTQPQAEYRIIAGAKSAEEEKARVLCALSRAGNKLADPVRLALAESRGMAADLFGELAKDFAKGKSPRIGAVGADGVAIWAEKRITPETTVQELEQAMADLARLSNRTPVYGIEPTARGWACKTSKGDKVRFTTQFILE